MSAVALKGAVIIEQQGTRMKYKRKCEKCGWVDNSTISTSVPSKNSKSTTSFSCPKCRNNQKVEIQGQNFFQ